MKVTGSKGNSEQLMKARLEEVKIWVLPVAISKVDPVSKGGRKAFSPFTGIIQPSRSAHTQKEGDHESHLKTNGS